MGSRDGDATGDDGERLIRAAFAQARASGKTDWQVMTLAVLKNRILDITDRKFSERDHGAAGIRDFVEKYPTLVELNGASARLIGSAESLSPVEAAHHSSVEPRVRADVWRAFMDFRSGIRYAWDPGVRAARPAERGDALIIPTVTPSDMASWRDEFAREQDAPDSLGEWLDKGLPTRALPRALQGPWNGFVRRRVAERASAWFEQAGVDPPAILVRDGNRSEKREPTAQEIREVIISCIRTMTLEELRALRLPAAAVARARR